MKTCALITEYNPFHNGHMYHLLQAKEITKSETVIVIMNGNFTQRGMPAVIDKWTRTEQAIKAGADLVIELPLLYGLRSAEFFSSAAVNLLAESKLIDSIVFGSESGNINILRDLAYIFNNENKIFKEKIQEYLSQGLNYPLARNKTLIDCHKLYENIKKYSVDDLENTLSSPNNILGIEYLKSVIKNDYDIDVKTIHRKGPDYHSSIIDGKFASASLIRKIIKENINKKSKTKLKNLMPDFAYEILNREIENGKLVIDNELIGRLIISEIRKLTPEKLLHYAEITNGLENRIFDAALKAGNLTQLLEIINAKNYTNTRIMRSLFYILLGIKKNTLKIIDKYKPPYIKILGLKNGREDLLKKLNENSSLPVIINPSDIIRTPDLQSEDPLKLTLSFEIMSDDLYSLLRDSSSKRKAREDYHKKLIKI